MEDTCFTQKKKSICNGTEMIAARLNYWIALVDNSQCLYTVVHASLYAVSRLLLNLACFEFCLKILKSKLAQYNNFYNELPYL
jgi:hypothetical protein